MHFQKYYISPNIYYNTCTVLYSACTVHVRCMYYSICWKFHTVHMVCLFRILYGASCLQCWMSQYNIDSSIVGLDGKCPHTCFLPTPSLERLMVSMILSLDWTAYYVLPSFIFIIFIIIIGLDNICVFSFFGGIDSINPIIIESDSILCMCSFLFINY